MKEYLVKVTSEVTKYYLIDASCDGQAASMASILFADEEDKSEIYTEKIRSAKAKIESVCEIIDDDLD